MDLIIIIIMMLFCHIVDDYYLQGWLASAKQKKYWKENAPEEMYKHDYIWALIMHGFSWSFMIMLPILIFKFYEISAGSMMTFYYVIGLLLNTVFHAIVDDAKANRNKINLIEDQLFHIMQIFITAGAFYL